jgi:large repetitive protein
VEHRTGEQQHPLFSPPEFSSVEQHELQKLHPTPSNSTLALANPEQQILAFIPTEETPLQPSTNPFASDTSNTTVSFLQPQLERNNAWNFDTPNSLTADNLLTAPQTTNSLTLADLSRIESTAVNFWQSLLTDHQPLEVNFQIGDLADGQIASAQVTKFSTTGLPIGGTITIDQDAQGAGWFIDATPLDWNEFTPLTSGALQAKPDSVAANRYDLFTTILHELGHIAGFGHGDTTFAGQDVSLSTDKNHITGASNSHDLMAAGLELGERRLPSALDIALIAVTITAQPQAYSAPLSVTGITNGDFSIASSQDPNFKWQTYGATAIMDGIAILSDTSKQLANLTQKFLIPPNATKLQFTIKNSQLGIRTPGSSPAPNDSFEVALLDAQMNPLAGKARGLSDTDSLLNLQADGTVYFSDKVQIGGVSTSGSKLANANDRTVTIDLAGIASNTEAMLYFDLLSFSAGASQVSIDNVKVFTSDRPAPQLQDANLVTNQATGIDIPAPNGATINEIELATAPQHGTVVRNANGQVIYTPKDDYVGTDSFSYLAFNSDGQVSNLATVNITVNNVAPTIQNIATPSTSKEGQTIQLKATAQDGGSPNNLTYIWNLGDGSNPITGREIAHTFADNGTYNVTLTVTDKDGGSTHQTTQITVDNVAPIVGITAPVNNINQGGTLNLGVNYSDPGSQDTHTITWNFGDGTNPVTGVTSPSHIFTKAGTNNVTLTVTDKDGASTTESVQINVTNIAPTINTVNIPTNINEGQPVQLTAMASDPGNAALTYKWYINGATTPIMGQAINYTFADNGIYPVKLEVIDTDGGITTQNVNVTVNNVAPTIIDIIKPTQIKEGQAVEFKSTATDPGTNSALTYSWNFGDNTSPVIGQNATHTFADNGNYNVVLTVTDKDGAFTTQTTAVKVDNVAPVIVSVTKPAQINEGQAVEFKASATDVGINDTLTYSWNFGDGTAASTGQNATHAFADNGNYSVVLTVTDKDGAVTTQTTVVKVDNVAPNIVSVTKPAQINEGQAVEFKATAIDPGVNDTLTYSWNFGDGTAATNGQNATHAFADNGNYSVVLTVTDKDGAVTTQTTAVKVDNVAPNIVSIAKPAQINEGQAVEFKATATDPGVNDTLTYSWNFGDGTAATNGQNATHTFADNGNYNVILTVTDKDGAVTSTQAIPVKFDNVAPTIVSITKPAQINEGQAVEFKATATDAGIKDTLTYSWNFGDGTTAVAGQNATHTFADNGNYNVVLTVTDKDGAVTSTQAIPVKVDNVAPTIVSIAKPNQIKEGQAVSFSATAADVGAKDTLTYSWNFGDNTNSVIGQNAAHTFADNGTYNVILTVTDKDGAVTTQTTAVTVDNVAPTITNLTLPQNVVSGTTAQFAATATDVGVKDTLTYSWNFGDNTAATSGQNSAHTFTAAGTYNIVLTVTDNNGAISTQTQSLTVTAPPTTTTSSGIRSGGTVTISGNVNLDGNTTSRADDTQIYAAKGVTLNGNVTLPVKRDAQGNPLRDQNGKLILIDNEITVAPGATTNSAYSNIKTATQTISIPNYADIKQQDFSLPVNSTINTFDIKKTPISNSSDWSKFPP